MIIVLFYSLCLNNSNNSNSNHNNHNTDNDNSNNNNSASFAPRTSLRSPSAPGRIRSVRKMIGKSLGYARIIRKITTTTTLVTRSVLVISIHKISNRGSQVPCPNIYIHIYIHTHTRTYTYTHTYYHHCYYYRERGRERERERSIRR